MTALALLLFIFAVIIGLIIRAVEIAVETGSQVVRKSSDFAHYVKNTLEDASNEVLNLQEELPRHPRDPSR